MGEKEEATTTRTVADSIPTHHLEKKNIRSCIPFIKQIDIIFLPFPTGFFSFIFSFFLVSTSKNIITKLYKRVLLV